MGKSEKDLTLENPKPLFEELKQLTREFPFCADRDDEKDPEKTKASPEVIHEYRLKKLIVKVRLQAIKKYRQSPEWMRNFFTEEDWIQEAFLLLYQPSGHDGKMHYYNIFILTRIPKRLTGIQERIYHLNPLLDPASNTLLANFIDKFKKEKRRSPTISEIAEELGKDEPEAERLMNYNEQRTFSNVQDLGAVIEPAGASLFTPEKQLIIFEERRILLNCLMKLSRQERIIIIQKFFYNRSVSEIAAFLKKSVEAVKSLIKRRYKSAMEKLKKCFIGHYRISLIKGRRST